MPWWMFLLSEWSSAHFLQRWETLHPSKLDDCPWNSTYLSESFRAKRASRSRSEFLCEICCSTARIDISLQSNRCLWGNGSFPSRLYGCIPLAGALQEMVLESLWDFCSRAETLQTLQLGSMKGGNWCEKKEVQKKAQVTIRSRNLCKVRRCLWWGHSL